MLLRRSALAAAAALLGVVAGAGPAHATGSWSVPAKATITVKGHGYGHGHGMSQYGAEGAARQGLGYRDIMRFYYPGTRWGTATGPIRVLLTADTSDDLVVEARRRLVVRDTAGGRVRLPRNGATRWRVAVGVDGVARVAYLADRWRPFSTLDGLGEFSARGRAVTLVTPSGERPYRGRLRLVRTESRALATVNVLPMDSYVAGVVPLEMPASWSPAAVRSQAVAARTYADYGRDHPQSRAYDLCDTTSCQVYGGASAEHPDATDAVRATAGEVLTSGGAAAFTQFASSSGGWTSAGSAPYLPAKRDPYDGWSGNPVHTWSTNVTDTAVEQAWPGIGDLRRITVGSRDGNGQWGGRVRTLTLRGADGRVTLSGDTFRSVLGLRSTWVTFAVSAR